MVTRKTRLLSGFVTLLMLVSMFTCFVVPVSAEASGTVAGTGLYDATALPNIEDGYTGATKYQVNSRAGLDFIADMVNRVGFNFSGVTIYQTADIDMGWEPFAGIGYTHGDTTKRSFNGTFDGNGFIIKNLYIARTGESVGTAGLISNASGATIKNVGIASGFVYGVTWVGGVLGRGNATNVYNCWNAATIVAANNMGAGGVVGSFNGSCYAYNCYNLGRLICAPGKMAGVVGWVNNANAGAVNCYNAGEIVAHFDASTPSELNCMYDYSPVIMQKYDQSVGGKNANNYYIKGRGKISSVQEYVNANGGLNTAKVVGDDTKVIISTDATAGLEATALTDGTLAQKLNGAGITVGGVDGYTLAYEQVEGVTYPVLTYRKDGAIAVQRTATAADIGAGEDAWATRSAGWAMLKQLRDGNATANPRNGTYEIGTANDLWLVALLSTAGDTSSTIKLTADIDMADMDLLPVKYHVPFQANSGSFKGTFDGQKHVVIGWSYYSQLFDATPRGAFITMVNGATVKNLGLVDSYGVIDRVSGTGGYLYPALLIEREPSGVQTTINLTMDNCFTTGAINLVDCTNGNNFGGVFSTAWGDNVKITNCWADVDYTDTMIDSANANGKIFTKGRAIGKINTAPAEGNMANIYQATHTGLATAATNTDNLSDENSTDLQGKSWKNASLAEALNATTMTQKWKFNGKYTTFAESTAPEATLLEKAQVAAADLAKLNPDLFNEGAQMKAAYDALVAAIETKADGDLTAALALYDAIATKTVKNVYPYYAPFAERDIYAQYNNSKEWGISTYEDWAALAEATLATAYSGSTFHLTNDVDMGNKHVDSIRDCNTFFNGNVNGHNHVFKNYVNYIYGPTERFGGLFAGLKDGTVENLGIENGTIKTVGDHAEEMLVGGIAGEAREGAVIRHCFNAADIDASSSDNATISGIARTHGSSNYATVDGCYNIGDIKGNTSKTSYAGGLSGYSQTHGHFYNSFSAGNTLTGKKIGLIRYNGNDKDDFFHNIYIQNTYSVDPEGVHAKEANCTVPIDAYSTGELAWKLNSGYENGKGTQTYYTLDSGKTIFGTATNQTRKVTIRKTLDDGTTVIEESVSYANAGTTLTLAEIEHYTPVTDGLNGYVAAAKTYVMPQTDLVIVYKLSGTPAENASIIVDAYADYKEGYKNDFDLFVDDQATKMNAAYTAAKSVTDGTAADTAAAIKTAFENFIPAEDLELKNVYPYYPEYSKFDAYMPIHDKDAGGRIHWRVSDAAEWHYIVENGFDPAKIMDAYPQYADGGATDNNTKINNVDGNYVLILHVTDDIDFGGVPMAPAPFGTNMTIDGHNHVFKNIAVEKKFENAAANANGHGVALIADSWNSIIQNLGIDGGYVKATGTAANDAKIYVSSFVGFQNGAAGHMVNCWSTADVINEVPGSTAANRVAAGLSILGRGDSLVKHVNCYYAGDMESTGLEYVIYHTGRTATATAYNHINVYAAGDLELTNFAASAEVKETTVLEDGAEKTGSLAWAMNTNYSTSNFTKYYPIEAVVFTTDENGVTSFGEAADAPRKITLVCEGYATKYQYGADGEEVALNYLKNATYAITSGNGTLSADTKTLTVNGDVTIAVTVNGAVTTALEEAVAEYAGKNASYYTNDAGENLAELLATAQGYIDTPENVEQGVVDALAAKLGTFKFTGIPKVDEIDLYPEATEFLIEDIDDMNYVANNKGKFGADKVLHFAENAEITVPDGAAANNWNGVHAAIDGHGVTLIGVDYVGHMTDWIPDGWLGRYAGAYLKNITFKGWTATNMEWQGALIIGSTESNTAFENLHFIDCSVTKTERNGLGMLVGIQQTNVNTTFKNISFEGCTLDLANIVTGNFSFLIGRVTTGTVSAEKIYLNGNKVKGTNEAPGSGRGLVAGEIAGENAKATFTDIGVFNTTYEGKAGTDAIIGGMVKLGAILNVSNVLAANNGTVSTLINHAGESAATITVANVYTDTEYVVAGGLAEAAQQVIASECTTADIMGGKAVYALNAVEGAQTYAIVDGTPVVATEGMPVRVTYTIAEVSYDTAMGGGEDVVLYTDADGELIGMTPEIKAELEAAAVWGTDVKWEGPFTEETTFTGTPYPAHTAEHETSMTPNADGVTHTITCTHKEGVAECKYVETVNCVFDEFVCVDKNAEPEDAQHQAKCDCGNEQEAVDCTLGEPDVDDPTVEQPGSITTECTICDYEHIELIPALMGLSMEKVEGYCGEQMIAEIDIENNRGLGGATFELTYNGNDLTLNKIELALTGTHAEVPVQIGKTETDPDGMVTVRFNFLTNQNYTGSKLLKLTFAVADDATEGVGELEIKVVDAADFEGVTVGFADLTGEYELFDRLPGDATGDKEITIKDAVMMMRLLNDDTTVDAYNPDRENADVNRDGTIDVRDVILVLQYLNGSISLDALYAAGENA